jgi:hypothetical protein
MSNDVLVLHQEFWTELVDLCCSGLYCFALSCVYIVLYHCVCMGLLSPLCAHAEMHAAASASLLQPPSGKGVLSWHACHLAIQAVHAVQVLPELMCYMLVLYS